MPETTTQGTPEPTPRAWSTPETTADAPASGPGEKAGRYDANVRLILRRLADHQRTDKPKRWWLGG